MLSNLGKKFVVNAEQSETPAQEMHRIVLDAVGLRRTEGAQRAVHGAARELRISESRVTQILRGKVARVWADEIEAARNWYVQHCDLQATRLAHEAHIYHERAAALKDRLCEKSV